MNSWFERVAGELHAILVVGSAMRQARAGHDTCGRRVTLRCRWAGAWPGFEARRRAKLAARTARGRAATHRHTQRPGTTRVEGAGGSGGRGLRDRPLRAVRLACGDLAGGRARRRPEHQRATRNTAQHRGAGPQARAPSATTQILRSTCVPFRSARAAHRSRRSSRSPRPRRRAGPRR